MLKVLARHLCNGTNGLSSVLSFFYLLVFCLFLSVVVQMFEMMPFIHLYLNSMKRHFNYRMMSLLILAVLSFPCTAFSQNSAIIQSDIAKLGTVASVLYIAAHPDDENTRLLSYLAKERKVKTAYLSLTRGDGGQNLIGSEQGEMLGLIRTEELMAARRTDGAEQFFTRANDFGYSKNPEETFSIWNKQAVLSDVVFAIRKFKPDVIICRFPTTGEGGHGHHTASAMLALEAFELASDPSAFADQVALLGTWKPKRVFWNTFNFGSTNTTSESQLKLDVGGYNPWTGFSNGEVAAASRSMHKSQGFGSAAQRGSVIEYFKLLKGDTAVKDIFDGIDMSWKRIKGGDKIGAKVQAMLKKYNAADPSASVDELISLRDMMKTFKTDDALAKYWIAVKTAECEELIHACLGIWAETGLTDYRAIAGKSSEWNSSFVARNSDKVKLLRIEMDVLSDTNLQTTLVKNQVFNFKRKINLPINLLTSDPYWLKEPRSAGTYFFKDETMRTRPVNLPAFEARYTYEYKGQTFVMTRPVIHKFTDPVKGEIYRPVEVLPAITVNPVDELLVFSGSETKVLRFLVKANADGQKGKLVIENNPNFTFEIPKPDFELKKKNDEVIIEVGLYVKGEQFEGSLKVSVLADGISYNKAIERIQYDHIPYRFRLTDAEVKVIKLNVAYAGKNIGYINGAGDQVPDVLRQMGYKVDLLDNEALKNTDLKKYDAIITGIRAFNTNEQLAIYQPKLMEYVANGGRLVVQYNTNSRVGPLQTGIGPYAFNITRNRVTDENAEIRIVSDSSSLLRFPNQINPSDFKHWVQERGIYFAGDIDPHYLTPFEMNDPNEKSDRGALIYARYGKGYFIYTGLAFFRQLPAGVPGACRLFVNLISQPVNG